MSQGKQLAEIAAANKAGLVSKGYCVDKYAARFVPAVVHYSPIVHRNHFVKSRCVETLVVDILLKARERKTPVKQVVSLGSGFSTLFMRLRDDKMVHGDAGISKFVEVDLKEILTEKKQVMENFRMVKKKDREVYQMIAADFRTVKSNLLREVINHAAPNKPTLIIIDCSLIFTPARSSDKILSQISEIFSVCYCVIAEPFSMYDVFGHFTMKYFRDFHLPLESPMKYSSLKQIRERYESMFDEVVSVELKHAARQCVSSDLYSRLTKLDLFNEYEELYHLHSHIALSLTTKGVHMPDFFYSVPGHECQCCSAIGDLDFATFFTKVPIAMEVNMGYSVFRHSSFLESNRLFFAGGFGKATANKEEDALSCVHIFACYEIKEHSIVKLQEIRNRCWQRLNASMDLCGDTIVVFGGKNGSHVLSDLVHVNTETFDFRRYTSRQWDVYPQARYRHASATFYRMKANGEVKEASVFIDGGRNFFKTFSDSFVYNPESSKWALVKMHGEKLPPRHSHSLCAINEFCFYLTGGLINDSAFEFNTCLYVLEFADSALCLVSKKNKNLPPMFGHTSHVYKCSRTRTQWLVLVGGIVPYCPYSLITMYDLGSHTVKTQFRIGGDCLLSNHTSHILGAQLWVVGGGGFMANYGTFFNSKIKCYRMNDVVNALKTSGKLPSLESDDAKDYGNVGKLSALYEQQLYFEMEKSMLSESRVSTSKGFQTAAGENNFVGADGEEIVQPSVNSSIEDLKAKMEGKKATSEDGNGSDKNKVRDSEKLLVDVEQVQDTNQGEKMPEKGDGNVLVLDSVQETPNDDVKATDSGKKSEMPKKEKKDKTLTPEPVKESASDAKSKSHAKDNGTLIAQLATETAVEDVASTKNKTKAEKPKEDRTITPEPVKGSVNVAKSKSKSWNPKDNETLVPRLATETLVQDAAATKSQMKSEKPKKDRTLTPEPSKENAKLAKGKTSAQKAAKTDIKLSPNSAKEANDDGTSVKSKTSQKAKNKKSDTSTPREKTKN